MKPLSNMTNTIDVDALRELLQGHFTVYSGIQVPNEEVPPTSQTLVDMGLGLLERVGVLAPFGVRVQPHPRGYLSIKYNNGLRAGLHYHRFTGLSMHISKGNKAEGMTLLSGIEAAIAKNMFPEFRHFHVAFNGAHDFLRQADENGFFNFQRCAVNTYFTERKPSGMARDYAVAEEHVLIQHTSP